MWHVNQNKYDTSCPIFSRTAPPALNESGISCESLVQTHSTCTAPAKRVITSSDYFEIKVEYEGFEEFDVTWTHNGKKIECPSGDDPSSHCKIQKEYHKQVSVLTLFWWALQLVMSLGSKGNVEITYS